MSYARPTASQTRKPAYSGKPAVKAEKPAVVSNWTTLFPTKVDTNGFTTLFLSKKVLDSLNKLEGAAITFYPIDADRIKEGSDFVISVKTHNENLETRNLKREDVMIMGNSADYKA